MNDDRPGVVIEGGRFDAVLFDLDGVVTRTARVHAAAWKRLFDGYLEERASREGGGGGFEPFDAEHDYVEYVDGKPRYEGVASFLRSRGLELPQGSPSDGPGEETVCGLGNRKNRYFLEQLERDGVEVYPSTVRLLRGLRRAGIRTAVVSSSANCAEVVRAAGLTDLFDARVDGVESERLDLEGKPAPDIFLEAARRLGVPPERAVVVEDAISGVEAGRRGHFGCVIGVDRRGAGEELADHGADVVVADLEEVAVGDGGQGAGTGALPSALDGIEGIVAEAGAAGVAVFLDYDGTLTPIVERPEDAVLSSSMRDAVRALAMRCTVGVISGRDLDDVRSLVGIEGLYYAGSHGFDIRGPDGRREQRGEGREQLAALDRAEQALREGIAGIDGAQVERKRFSVATHYRRVAPEREEEVEALVGRVRDANPGLRRSSGKKVFELQPDVDWDKGRALLWLLDVTGEQDALPLYLGDDTTDEDAFAVLRERGAGIVVAEADRPTAARYVLRDPDEVERFLGALSDRLEVT